MFHGTSSPGCVTPWDGGPAKHPDFQIHRAHRDSAFILKDNQDNQDNQDNKDNKDNQDNQDNKDKSEVCQSLPIVHTGRTVWSNVL